MYVMSEETKKNIERVTGLSIERIKRMTVREEQSWIEEWTGKKLSFSKERKRGIIGRGNPLLSRRKNRTYKDLDAKSRKYIGI